MLNFPGPSPNEVLHWCSFKRKINWYRYRSCWSKWPARWKQPIENKPIENIKKITPKCVSFGVKKIYVSGLVFTTRVDLPTLERVRVLLSNFCGDNGFVYIDKRNIKGDCLYQDGLHVLDTAKKILERNFIFALN